MSNEFSISTRQLFMDNYECWICKMNNWDCLHHIVGRAKSKNNCESSPLNAAPLHNYKCHIQIHGRLLKDDKIRYLLQKTYVYLTDRGYELTNLDKTFIKKYKKYYDNI